MWSTILAPLKLSEILINLSRFELIKSKQNLTNVKYLRQVWRYKEGRPHFQNLIRRWAFILTTLCHLPTFRNWRRLSSRLLIHLFSGTPCIIRTLSTALTIMYIRCILDVYYCIKTCRMTYDWQTKDKAWRKMGNKILFFFNKRFFYLQQHRIGK